MNSITQYPFPRHVPCPDCGAVARACDADCLSRAVQEGRITARERQIVLFARAERLEGPDGRLREQIEKVYREGGVVEQIVLGRSAWVALSNCARDATGSARAFNSALGAQFLGFPVVVSDTVGLDEMFVVGPTRSNSWSNGTSWAASWAGDAMGPHIAHFECP